MKYKIIRTNPDGTKHTYSGIYSEEKANNKINSYRAYYEKFYPQLANKTVFTIKLMVNKPKFHIYSPFGLVLDTVETLEDAQHAVEGNENTFHEAA